MGPIILQNIIKVLTKIILIVMAFINQISHIKSLKQKNQLILLSMSKGTGSVLSSVINLIQVLLL